MSNIIKNLSNLVGELDLLQLGRANDTGDGKRCLRCEKRSAASRQEGGDERLCARA